MDPLVTFMLSKYALKHSKALSETSSGRSDRSRSSKNLVWVDTSRSVRQFWNHLNASSRS